jgi:hypothetical protein
MFAGMAYLVRIRLILSNETVLSFDDRGVFNLIRSYNMKYAIPESLIQ